MDSFIIHQHSALEAGLVGTRVQSSQGCHYYIIPSPILMCRIHSFIHSFISIQPQRPGFQEPERSHVTGMALAHCIMGKFLGVVCHCFHPPLDVPTFAARCLYVRNDARDPSSERWKCGRERCPVILPKFRLNLNLGIFYMPQIYDMGPTALLPLRRKVC